MAVVNYSQVIKLAPDNEEPYFQRASIFEKTGDMLLAMEDYGSVVRINPTRTDALLKRALFSFKKGSWHSAVTDFTQLIQKEPLNAQARSFIIQFSPSVIVYTMYDFFFGKQYQGNLS